MEIVRFQSYCLQLKKCHSSFLKKIFDFQKAYFKVNLLMPGGNKKVTHT